MADLSEKTIVSQAEDTAAATGAAEADSNKPSSSKSSGNRAVTIVSRILTVLLIAGCVVMGIVGYRRGAFSSVEALQAWMVRNELTVLHSSTQIIIAPGYDYKIVKMLVTNFHQPQSTLLLLVSAFVKGDWRKIYDYALSHDFRFLSYGDSSLLIP